MIDTRKYGTNRYYLVTTNKYAGHNVNYSTTISNFDFELDEFEGKTVKITSFSDKMLANGKKIKKMPLAVIDMITTKFKSIEDLLETIGDTAVYDDILYDTYVGYFQKGYYAANPASFDDEVLHHIASEVRSRAHRNSKSTQTAPVINLNDTITNDRFRYLKHELLNNKDFADYYKDTANKGYFNRVDTHPIALLEEYWRYVKFMSYGTNLDAAENKRYARADIHAEMQIYKNFRTVYLADKAYRNALEVNKAASSSKNLKQENIERPKVKRKTKNMPDPNQISLFDLYGDLKKK